MITQKRDHDLQKVKAKGLLKLSHSGANKRQASGTNAWIKAFRQGHH